MSEKQASSAEVAGFIETHGVCLGTAGTSCPNPVLGVDWRRSPQAYKIRCTQGRQRSYDGSEGNVDRVVKNPRSNEACCARLRNMPLILILVILLLLFGGGGYYMGPGLGYYGGGGLSLILLIVILFLLFGRGRGRL
jgi:hypothetical protein